MAHTATTPVPDAASRWPAVGVFCATGLVASACGALLATGAVAFAAGESSWLIAYLVLIAGVAQCALGLAQAWLTAEPAAFGWVAVEWALFNLGNLGVITGSLLGSLGTVFAGTALFAAALALFALAARRARHRGWAWLYRALLLALLVAAVAGLMLASAGF